MVQFLRSVIDCFVNNHPDRRTARTRILNLTILVCLVLFLLSQTLFLFNIQYPKDHNFDESGYVPAAKQFLQMAENKNWEHPPLAKILIAVGILLFGDQPLGWRYMSIFFGSLTLVGIYLWALALFRDRSTALFAALITVMNQLLYVQARIGTLDIFMFAFTVFALAAFCAAWSIKAEKHKVFFLLLSAGVMFGLAIACKWAAIVPWLGSILMIIGVKVLQNWKIIFQEDSPWKSQQKKEFEDWYSPKLFGGISLIMLTIALLIVPIFVYFLTFLPYLFIHKADQISYSILDLFPLQLKMWNAQLSVVTNHPYMSKWNSWPLMIRPIWYAFDKEGNDFYRCVVMLGNPLIMWSGLIAILYCLWVWFACRSRETFLILSFYCAFYLGWVVIPRKLTFYYYYYPAGMTLSMAIAFFFHYWESGKTSWLKRNHMLRWIYVAACIIIFFYFFPVLSALKIPLAAYYKSMWFRSWI
jgi:dolichyl-phosphate-mannose--protein O-mannosyl transferase